MDSQQRNDGLDNGNDHEMKNTQEHADIEQNLPNRAAAHASGSGKQGGAYKEVVEWIKALVIAVVLVFLIRQFLFSPFIVDGPSMKPNFETGERLIVNKILYTIREPKFGEVVVFDVPEQGRKFIKRVIGVPGDKIRLEGDDLYINDKKIDEPYLKEAVAAAHAEGKLYNEKGINSDVSEITVPEDTIFALGDNRSDSTDSRVIGFVSDKEVVGRADIIFWPLNKLEFIKHWTK
ncbi:signal peptidase I [Paenibacillus sp. FSL A5-0031]|uniref:signal peptidase I n=1 Tax=Paenibacillus sp. FSL A5-0031 TaxID=1920420 RepID=UPI002116D7F0|nr:signal peptidase I [Paenibacillus sp. FSL A5-0031]